MLSPNKLIFGFLVLFLVERNGALGASIDLKADDTGLIDDTGLFLQPEDDGENPELKKPETPLHGDEHAEGADEKFSDQDGNPVQQVPTPNGRLNIFALPVGQGDAHVMQCPNGDLAIIDLGTSDSANNGFWHTAKVVEFLQGSYHLIKNVVITHNHVDHNNLMPSVLHNQYGMGALQNIYVSCTIAGMSTAVTNWLNSISATNKVRTFNGGRACGPNGVSCGNIPLCPANPAVQVQVMAVNMADCDDSNKNIDSVVFKVTYNQVSLYFNGDFEDRTSSQTANGAQRAMIDYYGNQLRVTVYKLSHHGAQTLANKVITCNAHAPKAIFVSSHPWYTPGSYRHPRCDIIDTFINDVKTLCQPTVTNPASAFYCAEHPYTNLQNNEKLQQRYTCGLNTDAFRTVTNNNLAIYTTVPDSTTLNLLEFTTDGIKWGFRNHYSPRA